MPFFARSYAVLPCSGSSAGQRGTLQANMVGPIVTRCHLVMFFPILLVTHFDW